MTRVDAAAANGPIRTVLVHLDGTAASPERLRVACNIGRRFGADVFAMFCVESSGASLQLALSEAPAVLFETRDWAALHEARRMFDEGIAAGPRGFWLEPTDIDAPQAFMRQARSADVVVVGARDPLTERGAISPPGFVEDVLMGCGRPVIVVPPGERTWRDDADVLVGWNGSAQAAHALAAALPWLRGASRVHVVVAQAEADASEDDGLDLHGSLRRHGIEAVMHRDDGSAMESGRRLARRAAELGAGLVVMGGFGHGRARERVLGGATEFMLRSTPLPVLMAH
jgi:nucleotide-binding universal stress UspA family protein